MKATILLMALLLLPATAGAQQALDPGSPYAAVQTAPDPKPQNPVQDWCAMHGLDRQSSDGARCSTAATLSDIQAWCANARHKVAADIAQDTADYCVQLLTGAALAPSAMNTDMNAVFAQSQSCANDPAGCATRRVVQDTAEQLALDFPDYTFMHGLSKDERTLALNQGKPCHIESFDSGENYHKRTWWYCDSDGNYVDSYTFLNGKLSSTYTP